MQIEAKPHHRDLLPADVVQGRRTSLPAAGYPKNPPVCFECVRWVECDLHALLIRQDVDW